MNSIKIVKHSTPPNFGLGQLVFLLITTWLLTFAEGNELSFVNKDNRRALHPRLANQLNFLNALFVVNNRPYVDSDIAPDGKAQAVSCLKEPLSLACKMDIGRACINPDSYLKPDITPALVINEIQTHCDPRLISPQDLNSHIARYFQFIAYRQNPMKDLYDREIKAFIADSKTRFEDSKNLKLLDLGERFLRRGFYATDLPLSLGVVACSEIAGLTYLQLLRFQEESQTHFAIHRVEIQARKSNGFHFNHVFLVLNAAKLEDGFYHSHRVNGKLVWAGEAPAPTGHKIAYGDFSNAYILDPYYRHFSLLLEGKNMHKGLYCTAMMVSVMPDSTQLVELQNSSDKKSARFFTVAFNKIMNGHQEVMVSTSLSPPDHYELKQEL